MSPTCHGLSPRYSILRISKRDYNGSQLLLYSNSNFKIIHNSLVDFMGTYFQVLFSSFPHIYTEFSYLLQFYQHSETSLELQIMNHQIYTHWNNTNWCYEENERAQTLKEKEVIYSKGPKELKHSLLKELTSMINTLISNLITAIYSINQWIFIITIIQYSYLQIPHQFITYYSLHQRLVGERFK